MGNLARKLEQDHQRSTQVQTTAVVKKQRFTLGEKILALIFGAAVFIGATQMISYQASIYEINKEIQQIETSIKEQEKTNGDLTIQVSELSTYERIWEKAQKLGLKLNENNVKVVQD